MTVQNIAFFCCLFKYRQRVFTVIHKAEATIHSFAEEKQQIMDAARKPPFNITGRDIMSAMRDPFGHAK